MDHVIVWVVAVAAAAAAVVDTVPLVVPQNAELDIWE